MGWGYPQVPDGGGVAPSRSVWGTPLPGDRTAEQTLATLRTVCLLRSRRRTFLFVFFCYFLGFTQVVFVVHGFNSNVDASWMKDIKEAVFSKKTDHIVGLVGWGTGAKLDWRPGHDYKQAVGNTLTMGQWLANHIVAYKDAGYKTYAIGHSLGSHVAGIAGRNSQGKLDRITGLDPAGPCFENRNQENRLVRSDAKFVDVIHTDGYYPHPVLLTAWICRHYGTLIPLGHLDFYPNNGYSQPGTAFRVAGSHERCIELFTDSIKNPGKFRTPFRYTTPPDCEKPADEYVKGEISEMGFYADQGEARSGNYYIETNAAAPWA